MQNSYQSQEEGEQILEISLEQHQQMQHELEQLQQEQKSCFSLTDVALIALGVSFF
jgi:hypothetical protein